MLKEYRTNYTWDQNVNMENHKISVDQLEKTFIKTYHNYRDSAL